MTTFERISTWMLYTAIENYRQELLEPGMYYNWLYWIQDIRLAKMDIRRAMPEI